MGAAFSNPGTDMRRWKRQVECNGKFVKRPPEDHKAMLRSGTPDNSDPNFRWDEGRRFHATSSYSLPNDQEEIDRLFQQHFIFKKMFHGNFHVPIENLLRKGCTVLDAGCGPGAWTLDMAIEYPDSHFYGIDICPVFDGSVHPPNVTFSLANLTDHLPFPDGHFDFVFMRCLVAGLQNEEWPRVICELMRVTKQGGWVELVEGSFRPHDAGPILEKIFRQVNYGLKARLLNPFIAHNLGKLLRAAGCPRSRHSFVPLSLSWCGPLGEMQGNDIRGLLMGFKPWLSKSIALYNTKYDEEVDAMFAECKERKSYLNVHYAYGMKSVPEGCVEGVAAG